MDGISKKERGVLIILIAGVFLGFLNQTLMNTALPQVMADFHISTALGQWLLWPQLLIRFHDGSSVWLNTAWWQVALWIYAILNLSLALNLSDADWQNTKSGALYYFIFLTIVALGVGLWINDAFIIWETVGRPIAYFFGGVLAATFIMYMLTAIIGRR